MELKHLALLILYRVLNRVVYIGVSICKGLYVVSYILRRAVLSLFDFFLFFCVFGLYMLILSCCLTGAYMTRQAGTLIKWALAAGCLAVLHFLMKLIIEKTNDCTFGMC